MELVLWVRDREQVAQKENVEQVVEIIAINPVRDWVAETTAVIAPEAAGCVD